MEHTKQQHTKLEDTPAQQPQKPQNTKGPATYVKNKQPDMNPTCDYTEEPTTQTSAPSAWPKLAT